MAVKLIHQAALSAHRDSSGRVCLSALPCIATHPAAPARMKHHVMESSVRKIVSMTLLALLVSTSAAADDWGPPDGHTLIDVRAYPDGSFGFRFTPALTTTACTYNDHANTDISNAATQKTLAALGTTAFSMEKKVRILYNGCHSVLGGVKITGLVVIR